MTPASVLLPHVEGHGRLRLYLLVGYVLFIAYASLSPFSGWQDLGLSFRDVLTAPLLQTYLWFDAVVNVLAYLPLGLLLGSILQTRLNASLGLMLALVGGLLLSVSMEYAQMFLPSRTSSNLDILTNVAGSLAGGLLAITLLPTRLMLRVLVFKRALFVRNSDFGLTLIALWAFAQVNPSLPMLGNVFITEVARQPFVPPPPDLFSWQESGGIACNLLMLGCLLLLLLRERRHAVGGLLLLLCAVSLVKFIAAAALLKSWALFLWLNSEAMFGITAGLFCLAAAIALPQSGIRLLAWASGLAYLLLTYWLLDVSSPSSAMKLYQWRPHLLDYNGLTRTLSQLLPYLYFIYLWRRESLSAHRL